MAWAEAYHRTKWHLDPTSRLVTTDMGRKLGAVTLWGGGARSLSKTQCGRGPAYLSTKFHLDPSNRLATIHQRNIRQTDRIAYVWRAVLQTVAQKNIAACALAQEMIFRVMPFEPLMELLFCGSAK